MQWRLIKHAWYIVGRSADPLPHGLTTCHACNSKRAISSTVYYRFMLRLLICTLHLITSSVRAYHFCVTRQRPLPTYLCIQFQRRRRKGVPSRASLHCALNSFPDSKAVISMSIGTNGHCILILRVRGVLLLNEHVRTRVRSRYLDAIPKTLRENCPLFRCVAPLRCAANFSPDSKAVTAKII